MLGKAGLMACFRERMAACGYPRVIEFAGELAKTTFGKVLKDGLAARRAPVPARRCAMSATDSTAGSPPGQQLLLGKGSAGNRP
jgi:hypothetical protein